MRRDTEVPALFFFRYQRNVGELESLGVVVGATTVRNRLRESGLGPVGTRRGMSWREFIRIHRHDLLAVDFMLVRWAISRRA
jgi:hypothetical protein